MDWNVLFPVDRFYLVKTWEHDNSIVYRFATASGELAVTAGNMLNADCKANTIFLKIQTSSYSDAYDHLKREDIQLPKEARTNGLPNTVASMLEQQATPFNCILGKKFIKLCKKHSDNIGRSKMEQGCIRIFTIVWAPNGERVRTRDMRAFIEKNYETQIWLSKVDAAVKAPVRTVMRMFKLGGRPPRDIDTGFIGVEDHTHHEYTHPGEVHLVRH